MSFQHTEASGRVAQIDPHLPHLHFNTDTFEEEDRLDALNTFSRGLYSYSSDQRTGSVPWLDLDAWALGDVAAASIAYGPTKVCAPRRLENGFEDRLFLRLVQSGRIRVTSGEEVHVFGPGDLFLMHARHALTPLDEGQALSLRLPYNRVGYDPTCQGSIIPLESQLWQVRVLVHAIKTLFETLPDMSPAEGPSVAAQLAGMVRVVIAQQNLDDEGLNALRENRVRAMRRYILDNLSRSELGVTHLQEEFNASRATVYRAFDEVGGVARFVREQRLEAIRRDLRDACPARGVIRRVAEKYGLWDQTSFLRMFRTRYGMRPSDVLGVTYNCGFPRHDTKDRDAADLPSLASFWGGFAKA